MTLGSRVFEQERRNWICLVGFAPSKKHAPFEDERWWMWSVNDAYHYVPRSDVAFELHHTLNLDKRRNESHEAVLRGGGKRGSQFEIGSPPTPIFMQEAHPDYPTVIAFPKERIISEFGKRSLPPGPGEVDVAPGADYFTNSIGWMIALAILELTEEREINGRMMRVAKPDARLGIYGISMAADSEYAVQRPNVEFWCGMARGYGIEVSIPDDAHILKAGTLYGYVSSQPLAVRLQADMSNFREQTIALQQQQAQLNAQLQQVEHQLTAIRAQKAYNEALNRNLVIGTEIGVGSDESGPHGGRELVEAVVHSDNQVGVLING